MHTDKKIRQPVHEQFHSRIINRAAALDKAAAENAVPALIQQFPVAHGVAGVIGFIRHHDDHRVAGGISQAEGNRAAETVLTLVLQRTQRTGTLVFNCCSTCHVLVSTAVVHHHDLMRDVVQRKLQMQMLQRGRQGLLLRPGPE